MKRHAQRFPADFMFRLSPRETAFLRFQTGTSKIGRGGRRYLPYAFTEHGVLMLSSVLNSERAVQINIVIMRAFVRLRDMLTANKELSRRLDELEKDWDQRFRVVFDAIRELMNPPAKPLRQIGFLSSEQ
ncbi:MAG: ORF6N domain-containing protein [Elusimicrobia bacterium]|nr:ORF6N domain-containing protein [Elusimicrobiota bacterium]